MVAVGLALAGLTVLALAPWHHGATAQARSTQDRPALPGAVGPARSGAFRTTGATVGVAGPVTVSGSGATVGSTGTGTATVPGSTTGTASATTTPGGSTTPTTAAPGGSATAGPSHWLASWGAAPEAASAEDQVALTGVENATVREIVMLSSAGTAVRIHFSNRFGHRPLVIGAASVAPAAVLGRLDGPAIPITFAGAPGVSVPVGESVVSDPVNLPVHALERLAISLYLPEATGPLTYHSAAEQRAYFTVGDRTLADAPVWDAVSTSSWYVITGVDTLSPARYLGTVATIGDSITAGFHSVVGSFGAWPDDLARRLSVQAGPTLGVIDEGISGNRLLLPSPCCGPAAVTRFGLNVLDQAGVRDVILLEGINDIGYSQSHSRLTAPHRNLSAAAIIAGYRHIITEAHAAGLSIFGATLLPFKGSRHWTQAGQAKWAAINRWILTSGAFNGVINFAALMAEPGHPEVLNPRYDSGDHLHPNNLGYATMAAAINLTALTQPGVEPAGLGAAASTVLPRGPGHRHRGIPPVRHRHPLGHHGRGPSRGRRHRGARHPPHGRRHRRGFRGGRRHRPARHRVRHPADRSRTTSKTVLYSDAPARL